MGHMDFNENKNDEFYTTEYTSNKIPYSEKDTHSTLVETIPLSSDQSDSSDEKEYSESCNKIKKIKKRKRTVLCSPVCNIVLGFLFFILAVVSVVISVQKLIMDEVLRMNENLSPYQWWKDPEPEILFRVFIFSVKNSEEFINGTATILEVEEVGPLVYTEELIHSDVVFHENSTMSYTVKRRPIFHPDRNEPGILNKTIIVPNLSTLGYAGSLYDANIFTRKLFEMMVTTSRDKLFTNITIYNYLWNNTSPTIKLVKNIVPFMVPVENMGVLHNIYANWEDRVNVKIGTAHGATNFFKINTYNYRPTVPGFYPENGDCFASIVNSSEAAIYQQRITKEDELIYWRRTLCRAVPLYFVKQMQKGSLLSYKFLLLENTFDRKNNLTEDCYKGDERNTLPDGLSDLSRCFFNFPVAASFPHFYLRAGSWIKKLNGLKPNSSEHESFIIIEPTTGVPLDQSARSQSNLILPDLSGFSIKFSRFSKMVIPMFWLEYRQKETTSKIRISITFLVNYLPTIQTIFSFVFILLGFYSIGFGIYRIILIKSETTGLLPNMIIKDFTPFISSRSKIEQ